MFAEIAEKSKDEYLKFYEQFGTCLKKELTEDFTLQLEIAVL